MPRRNIQIFVQNHYLEVIRRKIAPCSTKLNRTEEDNLTLFFLTLIVQVIYCQEITLLSVLHIFSLFFVLYVLKYYVLLTVSLAFFT